MKCITYLIWVLDIQLLLTKDVQTTLTTLRAMDTTAYEIGEIIKDDDTPIHFIGGRIVTNIAILPQDQVVTLKIL